MRKRSEHKYSTIIYCYDIETSSLIYGEDELQEHLQSTYLHGLASFAYRPIPHAPFSDFENEMDYNFFRTYDSISSEFERINEDAKNNDEYVKIFVHNLSYEFEAMMRNINFCIKNFNSKRFIAVAPHQPLVAAFDHLEFYDSFKILSCKSLELIGTELGVPKLKEVKGGYDQKYYWWSDLPDSEYIYNERDCKLVLYALCRYMANFTKVDTVSDIGVSNTSMIKRETRLNRNIATDKEVHTAQFTAAIELKNNEPFMEFFQNCLAGGYTHANPYAVGKIFKDVWCFDASSMHPSAMYGRRFPYKWRKEVNPNECYQNFQSANYEFLSGCESGANSGFFHYPDQRIKLFGCKDVKFYSVLQAAYRESILFERPIKYNFMANVTFYNINAKDFGNCIYSYISTSKCTNVKNGNFDNGKVVKADELTFHGCDIDFMLIQMLYDYSSSECDELYYATAHKFINKPLRNTVKYYARQKTGFKKLEHKVADHTETLNDFTFEGLKLYDDSVAQEIMNTNNKDLVHFALMASKGGLNGQYGCSAMKPLRQEVGVQGDGDKFEWIPTGVKFLKSRNSLNIFTDGLYTVAYSRLHLICFMLYLVLSQGIEPLYHDTDSGYFVGYNEDVQKAVDRFNENILNNSENKDCYNFGIMDFDGHYEDFVTWGSKCYCATYLDADKHLKVKATVAGASKKQLSELFTQIVNDEDFEYLVQEYFRPNISYDESINKKLIRKTPGTHIIGDFTDDNGETDHLDEYSVTVLEPCGYTLRSTNSPVNRMYYSFCYSLRGESYIDYLPEVVSINHDENDKELYGTYHKAQSDKEYAMLIDGNPASIFQWEWNDRR